jgi:hypothetical protein
MTVQDGGNMNYKEGSKRIAWLVSIGAFPLFVLYEAMTKGAPKKVEHFVLIIALWVLCFAGVWGLFYAMRYVVKGFKKE